MSELCRFVDWNDLNDIYLCLVLGNKMRFTSSPIVIRIDDELNQMELPLTSCPMSPSSTEIIIDRINGNRPAVDSMTVAADGSKDRLTL